ncbi:hypothetical protein COY71_03680 [Candidatus Micrarchaeota archaeon CG_4_10_14_0_8_um_filter_60_7]|nr:MAG: hypothetical protein COY71_03680 [Candidatus Micrarchaeota archaeon CG_4_10_14_0_8_um_filter_60_7]
MKRSNDLVFWAVLAVLAVAAVWFLSQQPAQGGGPQSDLQGASVSPTPQPSPYYYNEYSGPQPVEASGASFTCEKTTSIRGDQGRITYGCTPENAGDSLAIIVFMPVTATAGNYSSYQFADEEQYEPVILTFDSSNERATIDFHVTRETGIKAPDVKFVAGTSTGIEGGAGEAEYLKLKDEYLKSEEFKQLLMQMPVAKMTDADLDELGGKLGAACLLNTKGTGGMGINFDGGTTFDVEGPATAFNSQVNSRFVAYTVYADTVTVNGGDFTQKTGTGVEFGANTNLNVRLNGATGETTKKSYTVPAGGQKLWSVIAGIYEDVSAIEEYGTIIARQRTLDTRIEDFRQKAQLEIKKYLLGKIVESYSAFQESEAITLDPVELTELNPTKIVTFDIPAATLPVIADAIKNGKPQRDGWDASTSGVPPSDVHYTYDDQGAHGVITLDYLRESNYEGGLLKKNDFDIQIKLLTALDLNEKATYSLHVSVNHAAGTITANPAVVNFQFLSGSMAYYKPVQITITNPLPVAVHITGCGLENFEVDAKSSQQATLGGNNGYNADSPSDDSRTCVLQQNGVELKPFDASTGTHVFKGVKPNIAPETIPGG